MANSYLDVATQCWLWTGAVNNVGRPTIGIRENGRPRKILVSRYVAQFIDGEKLKRERSRKRNVRAHSCDNALCVNPGHLKRSTQKQNVRECVARGRHISGYALTV